MAKLDMEMTTKYLALGAGAAAVPAIVANFGTFATTLANIPFWGQAIMGITVGGVVMASVGVGLVDQFFFSK